HGEAEMIAKGFAFDGFIRVVILESEWGFGFRSLELYFGNVPKSVVHGAQVTDAARCTSRNQSQSFVHIALKFLRLLPPIRSADLQIGAMKAVAADVRRRSSR